MANELFADYVTETKLREPTVFLHVYKNKLSVPLTVVTIFFFSMYNKTIIRFGFVISRIIKVSVRVMSLSPPGEDSHMKQTGMPVGNFEFNP